MITNVSSDFHSSLEDSILPHSSSGKLHERDKDTSRRVEELLSFLPLLLLLRMARIHVGDWPRISGIIIWLVYVG